MNSRYRASAGLGLLIFGLTGCQQSAVRPELAQLAEVDDAQTMADMGDYWVTRASYPTGHFDPSWQFASAQQARAMDSALPAGSRASRAISALPTTQFTPLGPRPLGSAATGVAGRTNVIVSHPSNAAIAWIGSDGGGIWKTTNCCSAATTWTIKTDIAEIQNSAISDMVLDPSNSNTLYAATGDLRFGSFSFGANGVLKSTDGGETWTVKGADVFNPFYPPSAGGFPQYQALGQVEVDPNNSNTVLVGAKTGLYVSYDAGDNWTGPCLTNSFATQRQDITGLVLRDLGSTTEIVAAIGARGFETTVQPNLNQNGANGIYAAAMPLSGCPTGWSVRSRSDNGWLAGSAGGTPTPTNPLGRIDLAIAPSDPNVMYAQVAEIDRASPEILGVWRTNDGGGTWTRALTGTISGSGTQSWYNAGMTVHPSNPAIAILSAFNTFRTTTSGTAWSAIANSPHVDHHSRTFVAGDPNQLLIGTDGGVYYSANALATSPTWTALNATLNTIEFYSGGLTPNFNGAATAAAVGGAQDNSCMLSNWSGGNFGPQAWQSRNGGDGFFSTIEPIIGNRWYYSSQNGAIVASNTAQGGAAVSAEPSGWSGDRKSFLTNFDLYRLGGESSGCPAATGCGRMLTGSYRVWESVTGGVPGSSWIASSGDLTKGTLVDRSFINQVAYAHSTPSVAMAGTNDGNVWYGFNLGLNQNPTTAVWVNVTGSNAVLPNRPIMDVYTDTLDPNIGYAAVGGFDQNTPAQPGHVFQVTCSVQCASFSWRNVSGNLPNVPVNSVIVNPHNPLQVYAGTDWGLYYTDNVNAANPVWFKHAGLPNVMIWDLTLDRGPAATPQLSTTLAVWTRSRGAWVWPFPTSTDSLFRNGFE